MHETPKLSLADAELLLLLPNAKLIVMYMTSVFSQICHFRTMTQPNPLKIKILDPLPTQSTPTQPVGQTNPWTTLIGPVPTSVLKQLANAVSPFLSQLCSTDWWRRASSQQRSWRHATFEETRHGHDRCSVVQPDLKPRYHLQATRAAVCSSSAEVLDCLPQFQSACHPHHSVETAIDKVLGGWHHPTPVNCLVWSDTTWPIDTVDHDMLRRRLRSGKVRYCPPTASKQISALDQSINQSIIMQARFSVSADRMALFPV